jgi:transcriptional regulator with XRE-family HTH domain
MSNVRIRKIRRDLEDRGFTLADIARELGVTRQSVSKALRNGGDCSRARARIAEILGRDPWREGGRSPAGAA